MGLIFNIIFFIIFAIYKIIFRQKNKIIQYEKRSRKKLKFRALKSLELLISVEVLLAPKFIDKKNSELYFGIKTKSKHSKFNNQIKPLGGLIKINDEINNRFLKKFGKYIPDNSSSYKPEFNKNKIFVNKKIRSSKKIYKLFYKIENLNEFLIEELKNELQVLSRQFCKTIKNNEFNFKSEHMKFVFLEDSVLGVNEFKIYFIYETKIDDKQVNKILLDKNLILLENISSNSKYNFDPSFNLLKESTKNPRKKFKIKENN